MKNSSIRCSVYTCRHFDSHFCTLDRISVGRTTTDVNDTHDTECASFER